MERIHTMGEKHGMRVTEMFNQRAYMKQYARLNREHLTAYAREHRKKNRDRYNENAKKWREQNRDKINVRRNTTRLIAGLLSPAAYDAMFAKQKGVCAICGNSQKLKTHPKHKRRRTLCVDHDHKTQRVRALLCTPCNAGLGQFKDDIELLKAALRYLQSHGGAR
jgi:hypothetical protein